MQITDPHIFDGKEEASENKDVFNACIQSINGQVEKQDTKYRFVVVTGDLGLEGLIGGGGVDKRVKEKAEELANMLFSSKVKKWYFLPGNNDLYDELPYTIGLYRDFIKNLDQSLEKLSIKSGQQPAERVTAIDLCPRGDDPKSGLFPIPPYVFIGFNDASFKNNGSISRATTNANEQKEYVNQVLRRLNNDSNRFAYIFYHIPEVDDPYWVSASKESGNEKWKQHLEEFEKNEPDLIKDSLFKTPYRYSAWLVSDDVRTLWGQVVNNDRVRGLFAGHFHDRERKSYLNFDWMGTPKSSVGYAYDSTRKLWVCPPVAAKFQSDEGDKITARGFREVVISGNGNVTSTIYWYELERKFVKDNSPPGVKPSPPLPPPSLSRAVEIVELSVSLLIVVTVILGGLRISIRKPSP